MKWRIKKSLAQENAERYKTGGGSSVIYVDEKLVKMFGYGAISLMTSFDCDSDHRNESGIYTLVLC